MKVYHHFPMKLDALKSELKRKLAKGNRHVDAVLRQLQSMAGLPDETLNELTIIQAKWEGHKKRDRKGLFYPGERETSMAIILNSLLDLISAIELHDEFSDHLRRITFLAANPSQTAGLKLDVEFREIQHILAAATFRDEFDLASSLASRVSDLYHILLKQKPQLLHFAGHGELSVQGNEEPSIWEEDMRGLNWKPDKEAAKQFLTGIVLVDDDKDSDLHIVSAEAMGGLLAHFSGHLQCVLLNACYSEAQFDAISKHIPYVIGMKTAISDGFAIDFSRGFYGALGEGRSIAESFDMAKAYLKAKDWPSTEVVQMISQS